MNFEIDEIIGNLCMMLLVLICIGLICLFLFMTSLSIANILVNYEECKKEGCSSLYCYANLVEEDACYLESK